MKKVSKVIITLIIILFVTGCGATHEKTKTPNPINTINTKEELEEKLGYTVPVLDKEVKEYIVIDNIHGRIIYKDKSQFEIEESNEDVSGIYGGELLEQVSINNINVNINSYEDIRYAIWDKGKYSYSYSINSKNVDKLKKEVKLIIELIK